MSLNPNTLADTLWSVLQDVAALNPDGTPKPKGVPRTGNYAAGFATALQTYGASGVVPGALNNGGDPSAIQQLLTSKAASKTPIDVTELALAFAEYWHTVAVEPGEPAHGGTSVVSVTNNALGQVSAFEQAIMTSMTTVEMKPYYLHFIQNLQDIAISSIMWTVIEAFPTGGPQAFEESIQ